MNLHACGEDRTTYLSITVKSTTSGLLAGIRKLNVYPGGVDEYSCLPSGGYISEVTFVVISRGNATLGIPVRLFSPRSHPYRPSPPPASGTSGK